MQYEYKCQKCGQEQVKIVKLADKVTKEPCEKCGAGPEHLTRLLSAHSPYANPLSWSTWRI